MRSEWNCKKGLHPTNITFWLLPVCEWSLLQIQSHSADIPVTVACLHQLLTVSSPLCSNTPSSYNTGERTSGRGNSGWCLPALWVRTAIVLSVYNFYSSKSEASLTVYCCSLKYCRVRIRHPLCITCPPPYSHESSCTGLKSNVVRTHPLQKSHAVGLTS